VGEHVTCPVVICQAVPSVYGHFGPKTLWTQDILALCVWCRNVSHFCTGAEMSNGHFGTSAEVSIVEFGTKLHETLRTQN